MQTLRIGIVTGELVERLSAIQMKNVPFNQDVGNETYDVCDSSVLKKKIVVTYGQSVHLGCFVKIPDVLKHQHVTWYHHSKEKGRYV